MKIMLKILGSLILLLLIIVALLTGYINWFDAPSYEIDNRSVVIESSDNQLAIGEKIVSNYCVS